MALKGTLGGNTANITEQKTRKDVNVLFYVLFALSAAGIVVSGKLSAQTCGSRVGVCIRPDIFSDARTAVAGEFRTHAVQERASGLLIYGDTDFYDIGKWY